MDTFEAVTKAVSDPNRARILKMLEGGELCVCQITAVLGLANPTVSAHLAQLRRAGLIGQRRSGRWVFYALRDIPEKPEALRMLEMVRQSLNDDDTVSHDRVLLAEIGKVPVADLCGPIRTATIKASRARAEKVLA